MYSEKLRNYFKGKDIYQVELGKLLGYSPAMIGRYLNGTTPFKPEFITLLIKHFPDIDLQYIFSDEKSTHHVEEPSENYSLKEIDVIKELEEIERKASNLKKYLAQVRHK